ncbi:(3R)-hydroxymyristoyl-ACP dehydratase [compost metagenome]
MLLQSNFYNIKSFAAEEQNIQAIININPAHGIFKGHFPGQPVVPGVCMIQIIKELTSQHVTTALQLNSAAQVKFLQLLVPEAGQDIQVQISIKNADEEGTYSIAASLSQSGKAIMKMNGRFATAIH